MTSPLNPVYRDDALKGKVVVVTGAGGGLGQAIVEMLAAMGAQVCATDQRAPQGLPTALALACDITDEAQVQSAAGVLDAELGRCDVLVNNAGLLSAGTRLEDLSQQDWDKVFNVNLRGSFFCGKHFGRLMLRQGSGSIINLASIGAHLPADSSAYGPSKAGVLGLTSQMAVEWGPRGVRANSISPGMIRTPMSEAFYQNERLHQARTAYVPLGRIGVPDDIANAVAFLASDASAYMNGQDILVDGGFMRTTLKKVQPSSLAVSA